MAILTYTYQWSSATDEPPTGSQIRGDADVLTGIQKLWVRYLTVDGVDAYFALMASAAGWVLWLQDKDDHLRGARYIQTGPPIDKGGYIELPVTVDVDNAPLLSQQVILGLVSPVDSVGGIVPPGSGSELVDLATAKTHLHVTDDDHDADVQEKLTAASATIRDYLKGRNDPLWTSTTVPPFIASAVLLLLAHLYEHRGDEFGPGQDNDDRVWEAIANLCRRSRDPALA